MKLLFDENLSPRLPEDLAQFYPGSEHVHNLGFGSLSDGEIWDFAKSHGFAIVSKDSDFAERSVLEPDPPKIIWLRLGNCSTADVRKLLHTHSEDIRTFLEEAPETCLLLGRSV